MFRMPRHRNWTVSALYNKNRTDLQFGLIVQDRSVFWDVLDTVVDKLTHNLITKWFFLPPFPVVHFNHNKKEWANCSDTKGFHVHNSWTWHGKTLEDILCIFIHTPVILRAEGALEHDVISFKLTKKQTEKLAANDIRSADFMERMKESLLDED